MELCKSMVIISLVLLGACSAVAQAVEAVPAATLAIEANPVDALLPTASSTAATAPGGGAPTAKLRRNSLRQAASALNNATMTVLTTADPPAEISSQVVCGANSLVPTNFNVHCRIVSSFPRGATTCSAAKVGNNRLSTAGHCVYLRSLGGWARAVDVYCTGQQACGVARTTTVTNMAAAGRWVSASSDTPTAWDVAVLRTAGPLPGTALSTSQYTGAGTARARLTGYTGSRMGVNGCSGYNACVQYSSTDTMQVTTSGMYTSNTMDLCAGNSGGAVVDAAGSANVLVAVVSGEATNNGQCVYNLFAPSLLDSSVNENGCTRNSGGVSIPCLSRQLPA